MDGKGRVERSGDAWTLEKGKGGQEERSAGTGGEPNRRLEMLPLGWSGARRPRRAVPVPSDRFINSKYMSGPQTCLEVSSRSLNSQNAFLDP